jgi:hypothetical protein
MTGKLRPLNTVWESTKTYAGPSFTVHLLSPKSSVAAIAQVTRGLIEKENYTQSPIPSSFKLSVTELEEILEGSGLVCGKRTRINNIHTRR